MEIKFNWFQILDHMQFGLIESLKKNSPTHDGDLRKSLSSDVTDTQLTVYAIYYALYVEEGTMPHFPPIDALKKWCKDKLGDENAAYAVQKKIGLYGCLFGNSHRYKILTNKGYKSLSDTKIGDLVLTHNNRWKEITDKPIHEINYKIPRYTIELASGKSVNVTEEHPFYCLRDNKKIWVKAKDLKDTDKIFEVI